MKQKINTISGVITSVLFVIISLSAMYVIYFDVEPETRQILCIISKSLFVPCVIAGSIYSGTCDYPEED